MHMKRKCFVSVILSLVLMVTAMFNSDIAEAAKSSKNYWLCGVTSEMGTDEKPIKILYDGYNLYVSGNAGEADSVWRASANKKKIKRRHLKIASNCTIAADNGKESIKKFLNRKRKGKITGYVEIKVKKGKVIRIQYGV